MRRRGDGLRGRSKLRAQCFIDKQSCKKHAERIGDQFVDSDDNAGIEHGFGDFTLSMLCVKDNEPAYMIQQASDEIS